MTPDQARDKLDLMHSARGDNARLEAIFDTAIGVAMARLCFSREEALEEMSAYAERKAKARSSVLEEVRA